MTTHDTGFSATDFLADLDQALAEHDKKCAQDFAEPLKVCDYCSRSEISRPDGKVLTITQGSDGLWMCELCDRMLITLAGNGDPMPARRLAQIWPGAGLPSAPIPNHMPQQAKAARQLSREDARALEDKIIALVDTWSEAERATAYFLLHKGGMTLDRAAEIRRKARL